MSEKFDAAKTHFEKKTNEYRKRIKNQEETIDRLVSENTALREKKRELETKLNQMEDWVARLLEYAELSKEDIRAACEKDKEIAKFLGVLNKFM